MTEADVRWLQQAVATARERPLSELEEQGLIQAFEFTHELSWLLLKDFLTDQGVSGVSGSRDAVREAAIQELQISLERARDAAMTITWRSGWCSMDRARLAASAAARMWTSAYTRRRWAWLSC